MVPKIQMGLFEGSHFVFLLDFLECHHGPNLLEHRSVCVGGLCQYGYGGGICNRHPVEYTVHVVFYFHQWSVFAQSDQYGD